MCFDKSVLLQVTDAAEQLPVPVSIPVPIISPYPAVSDSEQTGGIQYPVQAAKNRMDSINNERITPPLTPPALPIVPYANSTGNFFLQQ